MISKYLVLPITLLIMMIDLNGQVSVEYQKPPKEILELADVNPAPRLSINSSGTVALMLHRRIYMSIEDLMEPEMKLAGLRMNPITLNRSRINYIYNIELLDINSGKIIGIKSLPNNGKMSGFIWSNSEDKIAFLNADANGTSLWVVDVAKAEAQKIADNINALYGNSIIWLNDDRHILAKISESGKKNIIDTKAFVPKGPTVYANDREKAQNRTYQDLLKSPTDEDNFEELLKCELWLIDIADGKKSKWGDEAMYGSLSLSPDGNYFMISKIKRPFSYIVPVSRFPYTIELFDKGGKFIRQIDEAPLIEELPKGFMAVKTGMRGVRWRADHPATIIWVEAQDQGDPAINLDVRDIVYQWKVGDHHSRKEVLYKSKLRFSQIVFGDDDLAVAYETWWNTRTQRIVFFNPSDSSQEPIVFSERNSQDRYNDPGRFITKNNKYGWQTLHIVNDAVYLNGAGYTPEGIFPFIDKYDLTTGTTTRLYQEKFSDKLQNIIQVLDIATGEVIVSLESPTEFPNYYKRNIFNGKVAQITTFKNPFAALSSVHKEVIKYMRDDGVELSAILYLPVGHTPSTAKDLPMLMWAYPEEFKDKASASQLTQSPLEFTYPYWGSPIYWLARGYVVLDDAKFPILGEKEEEPNDSFIPQLVANAKAAIDAVDRLGYINRRKVAIGGHSYGAFMTANLLTHSDLFAAGIARSGAYNRTLTPFGFQSEERNYWEAPDVYNQMSPFMHAHKMKYPLLLIHGEDDNNSGTFPMQSERYFSALKGLGAQVRLVMLPKESHGYAARESILHMLWEQDEWLEKYVKNRTN